MALTKNVLNVAKKKKVMGSLFHLLFMKTEAVLYDDLWDAPIIYGNKRLVINAVVNEKFLLKLLQPTVKEITLHLYKKETEDGGMKLIGKALKGEPKNLTIPMH